MSGFEFNKLMAAFLTAALFAMVVGVVSEMVYEPEHLEQNAYVIEGVEQSGAAEAPAEVPFPVALASADPKAGAKVFARCTACHDDSKGGPNKVGPELWSVVGRPIASADGFAYSAALQGLGGEWTFDKLDHFLTKPSDFAPGTKMSFAGLSKVEDRAAVIAYLNSQSDNPQPLPEAPAAEAPAADAPAEGEAAAPSAEGEAAPAAEAPASAG
ncbi:cytochrome c family protein [Tistrella bauzanensis]|uniref:Cytochrome c family protein n=1 Tax=Tistrella arctica TaxID=3133430 RepID=A0ABU9YKY3_9PROT